MWKYIIIPIDCILYLDEDNKELLDGTRVYVANELDKSIKQSWEEGLIKIVRTEDGRFYNYTPEPDADIWDDIEEWPYFVEEEKII